MLDGIEHRGLGKLTGDARPAGRPHRRSLIVVPEEPRERSRCARGIARWQQETGNAVGDVRPRRGPRSASTATFMAMKSRHAKAAASPEAMTQPRLAARRMAR